MKVKLSREKWEEMGKKAGWIKTAGIEEEFRLINDLGSAIMKLIQDSSSFGNDPCYFENDGIMRSEIKDAEKFVAKIAFFASRLPQEVQAAKDAIRELKFEYGLLDQDEVSTEFLDNI